MARSNKEPLFAFHMARLETSVLIIVDETRREEWTLEDLTDCKAAAIVKDDKLRVISDPFNVFSKKAVKNMMLNHAWKMYHGEYVKKWDDYDTWDEQTVPSAQLSKALLSALKKNPLFCDDYA